MYTTRFMISATLGLLALGFSARATNTTAIEQVSSGTRADANVAWWDFDPEDATDALQSAIDSGAKTVTVPYMGAPWIVRPITLRSNLELIFESGVLVLAKEGEFKGKGDSLFSASDMTDITIRGYGATLRMRKSDYQSDAYEKAEWRMGFAFRGCKRIMVEGIRVESSGGDGFYIGATGDNRWCEDVTIRNCVCHDHHRQGMSVISAQNLLVEHCVFSGTAGTAPQAGIDLEPNNAEERLVNCVFRNCLVENNAGNGILLYLRPLTSASEPVSIRFEDCLIRMGETGFTIDDFSDVEMKGSAGICVAAVRDDGPQGLIEFVNCTVENSATECVSLSEKSAKSAAVRFEACNFNQPWVAARRGYWKPRVPISISGRRPDVAADLGGIEFVDCHVFDTVGRPVLAYIPADGDTVLRDISGTIFTYGSADPRADLGVSATNVSLQVVPATE
jgi:polygalacturonase